MRKSIEDFTDHMVRNEVYGCVSALVSDLAKGYGVLGYTDRHAMREDPAIGALALMEEASELAYPVEDYEEALRGEGWKLEPVDSDDLPAFVKIRLSAERSPGEFVVYKAGDEFASAEDVDGYMVTGFTREEAARDACDHLEIEPYQWEVFEHWIVSGWLADELAKRGERVGPLGNLTVWGRTTTGQGIAMDGVILRIAEDCLKDK